MDFPVDSFSRLFSDIIFIFHLLYETGLTLFEFFSSVPSGELATILGTDYTFFEFMYGGGIVFVLSFAVYKFFARILQ